MDVYAALSAQDEGPEDDINVSVNFVVAVFSLLIPSAKFDSD